MPSLSPVGGKKTCLYCRYFEKRLVGSVNTGLSESNWGTCSGHQDKDLTLRGPRYLGKVHKTMTCQLPNVGLKEDWKPRYRLPQSLRPNVPWSSLQKRNLKHITKENTYMREWMLEQEKQ